MKIPSVVKGAILSAALVVSHVKGSIYTISDERVRNIDLSPVLGRGYSVMTNQFHSTCLMVDFTTVPSFDYDCKYEPLKLEY